jgi:TolB-like protein
MCELLTAVSAARSGRVFSSAGDGFMLEFPTATAGLEAALAVSEHCKALDPPLKVRIGLHSGEVLVQDGGDLLGHAVNIASRLQQSAKPGEIVLSEDVRRSARGALTQGLVSLGDMKLDKMSETLDIYAANVEHRGLALLLRGRRARFAGIGAALLAAVVLGAVLVLQPRGDVRTAVFALQAPAGDAELVSLARGVTTEIVDALNQIGIETASPSETDQLQGRSMAEHARSLGAVFAIDGEFVREGETVRAAVRLNDVDERRTLWTQSFERPSAQATELRLEAAQVAFTVMRCAVDARRDAPALASAAVSMLLRSCELSLHRDGFEEAGRLVEQVAQAAPRSSYVQGRLAYSYWQLAFCCTPAPDAQILEQALAAADAALRIDPANGEALSVNIDRLAYTVSRREWEEEVLSAVRRAPGSAELNSYYSWFLRTHGRPEEAVQYSVRARSRNPLSPTHDLALAFLLGSIGQDRQALDLVDETEARWPGIFDVWYEKFRINLWFGSRSEALRLLDEAPSSLNSAELQCFRRVTAGLAANSAAGRRQVASAAHECWYPFDRHVILASIGEVDAAFADVDRILADCPDATAASFAGQTQGALPPCILDFSWRTMFYPMTASMRRDPRFMPLMHRAGLAQYWLETDRWPDFCEDPSLPYDCRQEARRISGISQSP